MIKITASGGGLFTSRKIFFAVYSLNGIRIRVGFGWKTDAFPNNSLCGEDRMKALTGDYGGARRPTKEFTVEDFFPDEP